jgi:hypothetical protein
LSAEGVAFYVWNGGDECIDIAMESDAVEETDAIDGDVDGGGSQMAIPDEVMNPIDQTRSK